RGDWPGTGWRVDPEAQYSVKIQDVKERPRPRSGSQYTGPLYQSTRAGGGVPGYRKARARLITALIDDDDKVEEIQEIGGTLRQMPRYAYPNRRLIQVANGRVLYDDDCPYHYAPTIVRVALQPSVHGYSPESSLVREFGEIQKTASKMDSVVAANALRLNAVEV